MDTRIRVENVDYYSFGTDMKATSISSGGQLPKELNGHMEYLNHTIRKLPLCNLNVKIPPTKPIDLKMESLLDYIRQNGFPSGKPNFVTTKDLLRAIASMETNLIQVCRVRGVNYILKADKEYPENYQNIFQHFMTKTQNEQPNFDAPRTNGVFKATILNGEKEAFSVLYSGKVDAVSRTPKGAVRHYELKVSTGAPGADYIWSENSCSHFWQAFFGGSPSIIVGSRTDKTAFRKNQLTMYPKFSVYEIKEISRDSIPDSVAELPRRFQWSVSDGKRNIQNFLQLVKNHVNKDGDCFVFSRAPGQLKWEIKKDEKAVMEFRDTVRKYVTV